MASDRRIFPKRFLWGASISAHQTEGASQNQWSAWELENARSLAAQAPHKDIHSPVWEEVKQAASDPDNYVSGGAIDHKNLYKDDFDFLQKMHMNAFRFSLEWSRIEPQEGVWDAEAIADYRSYLEELQRRGVEPVVTLVHFSLPTWFTDKGGFEKRSNIRHFVRYAEKVVDELGKFLQFIVTINEPDVYAQNSYLAGEWPPQQTSKWQYWRVLVNQAHAHNAAAKVIHQMGRRYKVSVAKNSNYFYPGDDAWLSRVSASIFQYFQDDYFLKKVAKHSDYLAVNYYFSNRVYGYRVHNPNEHISDLGWDAAPGDIQYVLERLYAKYKKPLLVTENGIADQRDELREWWIAVTVAAMQRAIEHGVELEGYLHWSLLDNFEWSYGRWPRFGLVAVDYDSGKRALRSSAKTFGRIIKKLRG